MLEGLQQISWAELSHAYGAASDIPALLLALTSDQEERRRNAIGAFFATICHQGTVYQASAYTAPFLIELLTYERIQGKEAILNLLANLAQGAGYHHQHLLSYNEEETQEAMGEPLFWVRKTHQAVAEGRAVYESLLHHADSEVRMGAAYVLAHFPAYASHTFSLLSTCFQQEVQEVVKANLLFCLSKVDQEREKGQHFLEGLLMEEESLLLHFVAALVLVSSGQEAVPQEVIDLLIQVGMQEKTIDESFFALPWRNWRPEIEALKALQRLKPDPARSAVQGLLAALRAKLTQFGQANGLDIWHSQNSADFLQAFFPAAKPFLEEKADDPFLFLEFAVHFSHEVLMIVDQTVRTAASLAFREEEGKEGVSFDNLSPEQQQVLVFLAECGLAWNWSGDWLDRQTGQWIKQFTCAVYLRGLGLPQTQEQLRRFIQGE